MIKGSVVCSKELHSANLRYVPDESGILDGNPNTAFQPSKLENYKQSSFVDYPIPRRRDTGLHRSCVKACLEFFRFRGFELNTQRYTKT